MEISSETIQLAGLVLITLVTNFSAALGLSVHVDSWLLCRLLNEQKYEEIRRFYANVGIPYIAKPLIFLWRLSGHNLLLPGLLLLFFRILHTISIYCLLDKLFPLSNSLTFVITLALVVYPAITFIYDYVVGMLYGISWPLFTVGCFLIFFLQEESQSFLIKLFLILIAFFCFFLSYNMKSILVMSVLLSVFIWFFNIEIWKGDIFLNHLFKTLFLILPVCYWKFIEWRFPRSRNYSNYNQFVRLKDSLRIFRKLYDGLSKSVFATIIDSIRLLGKPNVLFFVTGILSFSVFLKLDFDIAIQDEYKFVSLVFGIFLMLCVLLPYVLVNQDFDNKGYLTKNFVMGDLPFSIILSFLIFGNPFFSESNSLVFILLISCMLILNLENQILLWMQYAKHIQIRVAIRNLAIDVDTGLVINDKSKYRFSGYKDKFYPMTILYLLNCSDDKFMIAGIDSTAISHSNVRDTIVAEYYQNPMPEIKNSFSPVKFFRLNIYDKEFSFRQLFSFLKSQFRKNPFSEDLQPDLFKIEILIHGN